MRRTFGLEKPDGLVEVFSRALGCGGGTGHHACAFVERRLREWIVRESDRTLERTLRLDARGERACALAGADQHVARLFPELHRIGGVGSRVVRVEVVRGDNFDDLA